MSEDFKTIAFAGNPNVGKSTLFNALTGLKQHTGNWSGKTVSNAVGDFKYKGESYKLVDIPGTYSLFAHSAEEEVARDFICFEKKDKTVVVCDASALERNLNLVLQTAEVCNNLTVCINLVDEAEKKGIRVDIKKLSALLQIPVVATVARNKKTLKDLISTFSAQGNKEYYKISYPSPLENEINSLEKILEKKLDNKISSRWLALRILSYDTEIIKKAEEYLSIDILNDEDILNALEKAEKRLFENGIKKEKIKSIIASTIISKAEDLSRLCVLKNQNKISNFDKRADDLITGKKTGFIIMTLFILGIFWLTIWGANYLSDYLSMLFSFIEKYLKNFLSFVKAPQLIRSIIIEGFFRVPSWVISVMLPPMAIFFPLFTLLEDSGFLPRIAFCLDKPFKCCKSCGKQALTMCMGFGCNAAGVVGCRIIDSKRERLLAVLSNSLVPCNGKFPSIIALISIFFVGSISYLKSVVSALILTLFITLCIIVTFITTKFLSMTLLKGQPSSYTLEMPPYRRPQFTKVFIRSLFDRTIFVLIRAVTVAIPAGIVLWCMANFTIQDVSILKICSDFLDPFAKIIGLDGIILLAFILGFPANEIVLPIILMCYLSNSSLVDISSLSEIKSILVSNGWSFNTALCTIIFSFSISPAQPRF